MRTHLVRTFYPSPAIEFDTDSAANDDCPASASAGSLDTLTRANVEAHGIEAKRVQDEYSLGGYAGICTKQ